MKTREKVIQPTKFVSLSERAQCELEARLAEVTPELTYNQDHLPIVITREQAEEVAGFIGWCVHWGELKKTNAKLYIRQVMEATAELGFPEELGQLYESL